MPSAKERYADKSNWLVTTVVRQGCSIGAASTICPGIELGDYSFIAAGSVVTKNVDPYSLVMGSPARRVHYVCGCGQKLLGHFLEADCLVCGQTGADREAWMRQRVTGSKVVASAIGTPIENTFV